MKESVVHEESQTRTLYAATVIFLLKEDLLEVANEWAKDDNYVEIYIRKVSKDQYGIGFAYKSEGKEAYDVYFDKTSDFLKRKFGNDGDTQR